MSAAEEVCALFPLITVPACRAKVPRVQCKQISFRYKQTVTSVVRFTVTVFNGITAASPVCLHQWQLRVVHAHTCVCCSQYFVAQTCKDNNLNSITHAPPSPSWAAEDSCYVRSSPPFTGHVFRLWENFLPVEGYVCVFHVELPSRRQ